jgi:hypothetical protein
MLINVRSVRFGIDIEANIHLARTISPAPKKA